MWTANTRTRIRIALPLFLTLVETADDRRRLLKTALLKQNVTMTSFVTVV